MRIKKGDTVIVIAGKDKGKTGKVLKTIAEKHRVVVENVNVCTKHQKARGPQQPGGIIKQELPIDVSNVMYYDAKNKKGSRLGYKLNAEGKKLRVVKTSGEVIE